MNTHGNSEVPAMMQDISGHGDPLVLLPGGLTGWLSWISHAEILVATHRVIRLQLHNVAFGLAGDPLPPTYSVDFEVTALSQALDTLAIDQADFAGWSYGAAVLLSYSIRHPDRVRSLTLIEPPAFWVLRSQGPFSEEILEGQRFTETLATDEVTEEQLVSFAHFAGLMPEAIDPRTIPQWPVWFEHRQSLRMGDQPYQHEDNIELVRRFEKPALLVTGEGSSTYYYDIIDVLAKELPDARVVSFPGGHAAHIVSMNPFMTRFTQFLSMLN